MRARRVELRGVGDELEETAVRVAEVDAPSVAPRAAPGDWTLLDLYALTGQVRHGLLDRAVPDEAQIAVAGSDGNAGEGVGVNAGTVHVQLLSPEPIGPGPAAALDQLRAEHFGVEAIGPLPVRDVDDAVVEFDPELAHDEVRIDIGSA